MTTLNKDLFTRDPTQNKIPNDGVAKVVRPETSEQWTVLRWELESFVCEGEYERGLERILGSFLANLGQAQQPAVWVSGFYGSGKSHLCRVLEYLWRDIPLPSGESTRSLVQLPSDVDAHLRELSTAGKRLGGLWSAAGTLGAGRSRAVRLAFLSVLFESAGLPEQYPLARFTIWAQDNGYYDQVVQAIEAAGKSYRREIRHLYVSPIIAKALLDADPTLGDTVKDVRELLSNQFPSQAEDITDDEMFAAIEDVLRLQSERQDRYPLTLVILDEMQQYLGDDNAKTLAVQNIVEGVSSRFNNSVLFIATGQSQMGATPTLQKLTDRFPVHVHLSDKDVETVVRQVILRKKPDRVTELRAVLDDASGEIDRHLEGTRIGAVAADKQDWVPDYPLLPTRRRFWELALRALDRAGKSGVLRTQLRIIHEATREVAHAPVGHVIGADSLYDQQAPSLQTSGVLLKEIDEFIRGLKDDGPDGELKSRICALIFVISQIPQQMGGAGELGLRPTAAFISDLLVMDLQRDRAQLRKRVPELLEDLVKAGRLMQVGDEYRLQTEEGSEWESDYRSRLAAIRDDASNLAALRSERIRRAVEAALGGLKLSHGKSRTPRKIVTHFGADEPTEEGTEVPIWIRDEWTVTEATARSAAAQAGEDSPIVHVLLPKRESETIRETLASCAAAAETCQTKPTPQTDEGKVAKRAMQGRVESYEERLDALFREVISNVRVYQGGGSEVTVSSFRDAVELVAQRSLVRLFPKFDVADDSNWGKVVTKARDGAPDALQAVGHSGDAPAHPVCKEVLAAVTASGTKGAELIKRFSEPPYGWSEDAIRGAVMALLATRHLRAAQDGVPLTGPKQLEPRQIAKTTFYKEDEPPTTPQRLAVRGLLAAASIPYESSQEQAQIPALLQKLVDLATEAGGPPPLPDKPDTSHVLALQALAGNQQFRAVADAHDQLKASLTEWQAASTRKNERLKAWDALNSLLHHARDLEASADITEQCDAIRNNRQLLDDPDPVRPLLDRITGPLRESLVAAADQLRARHGQVISDLEATEEWQALDGADRQDIIAKAGLQPPPEVDVSSQATLLDVLNYAPLNTWSERAELLPARAARARVEAAKRLEPTAARVTLGGATLKSESDVDAYLDDARRRIMQHITDGHTVIV